MTGSGDHGGVQRVADGVVSVGTRGAVSDGENIEDETEGDGASGRSGRLLIKGKKIIMKKVWVRDGKFSPVRSLVIKVWNT